MIQEYSDSCAMYINCSRTGHYLVECKYPDLYSPVSKTCQSFKSVTCGKRPEPQKPCKFLKKHIYCSSLKTYRRVTRQIDGYLLFITQQKFYYHLMLFSYKLDYIIRYGVFTMYLLLKTFKTLHMLLIYSSICIFVWFCLESICSVFLHLNIGGMRKLVHFNYLCSLNFQTEIFVFIPIK